MKVYVGRRKIAYAAPFSVETFKGGLSIGVDALGCNCVRFSDSPLALGTFSAELMRAAVDALNLQPVGELIEAEV